VDHGQGAGQLDAADGDGEDGQDLDGQQPAAGPYGLVVDGYAVARADQRVAQGERGLDGDQPAGLQAVLQQEQRADPGGGGRVQLPGGEERPDALVQVRHCALEQGGGQRVAAGRREPEGRGPGVAAGPDAHADHHGLESAGDDQGLDPDLGGRVIGAAGRRRGGQADPEAHRDQGHRAPGGGGQPAPVQLARHQQGERQLDDEDGLDQGDGASGQGQGLGDGGHDHHPDAGQPHLSPDQVAQQRQVERRVLGRGGGGLPLQHRGHAVTQRGHQSEQDRQPHHRGILC
jgi:hypothetical protein